MGLMKSDNDVIDKLLFVIETSGGPDKIKAAKAVGYIASTGVMGTQAKMNSKEVIINVLVKQRPPVGVAFALLEALERIHPDEFWQLVMGWYGLASKENKVETSAEVSQQVKDALKNPIDGQSHANSSD